MTDGSGVEQLSVVVTTKSVGDVTETTAADVATSSSPGSEFYFQCAIIVIGAVGTATNALILYAMVASKQLKKQLLIFHQNVLDCFSSLLLMIIYAVKLCNIYLIGSLGYWLCMWIISECLIHSVISASRANLIFLTIERYLKVVYPVWSKKKLRKWMIYSAMTFAWIGGFVHVCALAFNTSGVVDGVCYAYVMWESRATQTAYGIFNIFYDYVLIICVFIFCYWRILIVIRRQASVMAGHSGPGALSAQIQSNQMQSSVIKTMILVSVFYGISNLPLYVYYMPMHMSTNATLLISSYYAPLFISYFYFCANPFIYALKFDPVKRVLLRLIPCKKNAVQAIESIDVSASHRPTTDAAEARN